MSSKDEKEKENEDENEDENKNILLEYMENVADKLFKKYSNGKKFNSFIDEFDRATNEENKEKVVKELKDINSFVERYAQMEDDYNEYECKLFDIIDAVDYFWMNTLKTEQVILIGGITKKLSSTLCKLRKINFFLVYV